MEPAVEEVWSSGRDGSNLLGLPGPCPWDDDDEPLGQGGIKPKSSPIPRRRSSDFLCSDEESQPPLSSSRRVSFADAFGLSLVSVKQFDSWSMCGPLDPLEGDPNEEKEYFISQLFTPPSTSQELIQKVLENKLELESLELLPGTTTLKGIIRVLNLCFDKLVYVRTSLDCWSTHFDLLAEYIPGSSDGDTDCFSFRLTLVPPFGEQGARADFCLRYETPLGTFWSNNGGQNYVVFCHEKTKEQGQKEKRHKKKSCLKATSHDCSSETVSSPSTEDIPEITLTCGMTAVAEPVKEEKVQEDSSKLKENISNRSRRSRRKAARLAKVKQYFAEREKTDNQQFEKGTSKAAKVESPVSDEMETSSNLSAPLSPAEEIKTQPCPSVSGDTDSKQVPQANIQTRDEEHISTRHCELGTFISQPVLSPVDSVNSNKSAVSAVSQALDNSQNQETLTSQTVSVVPQLECQTTRTSISKSVEKAWECFEKGAMGRVGSTMDVSRAEDTTSTENEVNHKDILDDKPDTQPSGHNFTFETIVAPLYHQVFERMEIKRRDFFTNMKFSAVRSVGTQEDECLRTVTYQSYPRTQSLETRPNSCTSKKHDLNEMNQGTSRDLCPPDLLNSNNTKNEPSPDTNVNREREQRRMETAFHDISVMDLVMDINISELNMMTHKQQLSNNVGFLAKSMPHQNEEERNQGTVNLHSKHCSLESTLEDPLQNTHSQLEDISVDYMVLTTQSDLYCTNVKTSPTVSSSTHISFETGISTGPPEIQGKEAKALQCQQSEEKQTPMESTFNEILPSSKCLEESHSVILDSSSFYTHITSNVTPKFNQREASEMSQKLASLTPIQMPEFTLFQEGQKAADIRLQCIEGANLIENKKLLCEIPDGNSHQFGKDTETNIDRNNETSDLERTYVDQEDRTSSHVLHSNNGLFDVFEEHKDVKNLDEKKDLESTDKAEHQSMQILEEPKEKGELVKTEKQLQQQEISDKPKQEENEEQKREEKKQKPDQRERRQQDEFKEEEEKIVEKTPKGKEEQQQEAEKEVTSEHKLKEQEHYQQEVYEKREQEEHEELEVGEEELEEEQDNNEDDEEEEEEGEKEKEELKNEDSFEDELLYIDDDEEEAENEIKSEDLEQYMEEWEDEEDHHSLEVEVEEQDCDSRVSSTVATKTQENPITVDCKMVDDLQVRQELQRNERFVSVEEEIQLDTDSTQQAITGNHDTAFSDRAMLREEELCFQTNEHDAAEDAAGGISDPSEKNVGNDTSTESLSDDEMDLYFHQLKNSQKPGLKESVSNGNYCRRSSASRPRAMPSRMPSISESVDEDQPNASLVDLTNEEKTELEKATLPLVEEEEEMLRRNVLWWREFFSSDNMAKMLMCTFLLFVFLVTAYYYDFVACFGLYLLALYWLYFRGESEAFKVTQPNR